MRVNLLKETLEILQASFISLDEVRFVRNDQGTFTWGEFRELAKIFDYDNGYGSIEVNQTLKIVGDDWWLERVEYDGSEWWEFRTKPAETPRITPIREDLED